MPETAPYPARKHSPIWLWSKRIIYAVVALIVLAVTLGLIDQAIFVAISKRRYPAPGRLVNVGGYRMHINCMGSGTPTVILESGLGGSSPYWMLVQPEVAKFTRVCAYDRAGLGWSDARPGPRTSKEAVSELSSLLAAAEIGGPYVFVGHSLGGYHARLFVSQNRDRVAGVVLVDSSHPDQEIRAPESPESKKRFRELVTVARLTMIFGLPRWLGKCGGGDSNVPRQRPVHATCMARECRPEFIRAFEAELDGISESRDEVRNSGTLGDIPLIVISRDPSQSDKIWDQMQSELAQLSSRGTHIIAKGSGHFIQLDRPDVVVDAIHRVFEEAERTSQASSHPH